jgi:hypothetical protein
MNWKKYDNLSDFYKLKRSKKRSYSFETPPTHTADFSLCRKFQKDRFSLSGENLLFLEVRFSFIFRLKFMVSFRIIQPYPPY